jgi:polysaccharide deacetylase family protein (PEP-CTERM system associated)
MNAAPVINAMTVDVEDYFHVSAFDDVVPRSAWEGMERRVARNTRRLLDLFDEFGVHGTFFVLGWVADRDRALVREIAARGHEIASHGYAHRLVYDQTLSAFRNDVRRAKQLLEDATGVRVRGYRAPSFSVTARSLWALEILIEEGHTYDASIFPIRHDRYGIPGSPRHMYALQHQSGSLSEVPASTVRIGPVVLPIAGGGYFRQFPYSWTRWGIARVNNVEQQPVVFYLHPWEIDADQPRLSAGWLTRLRHYRNLDQTERRLRALLTDFQFGTVGSLLRTAAPVAQELRPVAAATLPYLW